MVRHACDEYWITAPGILGGERSIAIFARVRAVKGHVSDGAQITTSDTRATVYVTPSIEGDRLRWLVPHNGREFTARVVDDLLLSVFGNDLAATHRLSPYFSLDECLSRYAGRPDPERCAGYSRVWAKHAKTGPTSGPVFA